MPASFYCHRGSGDVDDDDDLILLICHIGENEDEKGQFLKKCDRYNHDEYFHTQLHIYT